jgi:hypothetical protein
VKECDVRSGGQADSRFEEAHANLECGRFERAFTSFRCVALFSE